jgi:hypothetical protein
MRERHTNCSFRENRASCILRRWGETVYNGNSSGVYIQENIILGAMESVSSTSCMVGGNSGRVTLTKGGRGYGRRSRHQETARLCLDDARTVTRGGHQGRPIGACPRNGASLDLRRGHDRWEQRRQNLSQAKRCEIARSLDPWAQVRAVANATALFAFSRASSSNASRSRVVEIDVP